MAASALSLFSTSVLGGYFNILEIFYLILKFHSSHKYIDNFSNTNFTQIGKISKGRNYSSSF